MTYANRRPFASFRRGFTLIELLVVVAIIVVVVSIVVPALSSVRTTARVTETRGLGDSMTKAISQFRNDNNLRNPGYFSQKELGVAGNEGLTPLFNALIEMVGGETTKAPDNINIFAVGPQSSGKVNIDLTAMGGSGKYFSIPKKYWSTTPTGKVANGGNQSLPDFLDAFKTPMIMWVEDDTFAGTPTTVDQFASIDSSKSAKFYWESNAAMLKSTALGAKAANQTYTGQDDYSMVGDLVSANNRVTSLAGFLGHPGFPYRAAGASMTTVPLVAAKSRGSVVVHSAGSDGIFLNANDRGGKQFTVTGGSKVLDYRVNFVTSPSGNLPADGYLDKDGKPTTVDVIEKFDDVVLPLGG